jgi:Family of unknown function (DUF5329)
MGGKIAGTLAFLLALAPSLQAAPPAADREIDALLSALRSSGCRFRRNGTWYDGAKAASHLQEKRAWLDKRGRIASAEDFIRLAGTESSLSGRSYAVKCPDRQEEPSGGWLRRELLRLRRGSAGN